MVPQNVQRYADGSYAIPWEQDGSATNQENLNALMTALAKNVNFRANFEDYKMWMESSEGKTYFRMGEMSFLDKLSRFCGCMWNPDRQITPEARKALGR